MKFIKLSFDNAIINLDEIVMVRLELHLPKDHPCVGFVTLTSKEGIRKVGQMSEGGGNMGIPINQDDYERLCAALEGR